MSTNVNPALFGNSLNMLVITAWRGPLPAFPESMEWIPDPSLCAMLVHFPLDGVVRTNSDSPSHLSIKYMIHLTKRVFVSVTAKCAGHGQDGLWVRRMAVPALLSTLA